MAAPLPSKFMDSLGRVVTLGRRLGEGGEGAVFEQEGQPGVAVKVYLKPLDARRAEKIRAMAGAATPALQKVAAWPQDLLFAPSGQPQGLLMPKIAGGRELHDLYSPKSRRVHFPDAGYAFLVHVAANLARAFATVHAEGAIIGDVNERGLLVARDGTVTLIDCDSFQITAGKTVHTCDVGVPIFTPPELQGKQYRGLHRTTNHDNFGLATLIFHLLFLGRHPFAGRWSGDGDMPPETAIREFRYAYGRDRARFQMEPPPHMPLPASANPSVADLFEQAFSPQAAQGTPRPTAAAWVAALENLRRSLKPCTVNAAHAYVSTLTACPWCEVEARLGTAFFNFTWPAAANLQQAGVETVWRAICGTRLAPLPPPVSERDIPAPPPPAAAQEAIAAEKDLKAAHQEWLQAEQRAQSKATALERLERRLKHLEALKQAYWRPWVLPAVVAAGGTLAFPHFTSSQWSAGGALLVVSAVLCGLILWLRKAQKHEHVQLLALAPLRRSEAAQAAQERDVHATRYRQAKARADQAKTAVHQALKKAERGYKSVLAKYRTLEKDWAAEAAWFKSQQQQLATHYQAYRQLPDERRRKLQDLHANRPQTQLHQHLNSFFIEKEEIPGIYHSLKVTLTSYNIETAADITAERVRALPGFGERRTEHLLKWRRSKELSFRFDPTKGVDPASVQALDQEIAAKGKQLEQALRQGAEEMRKRAAALSARSQALRQESLRAAQAVAEARAGSNAIV